VVINIDEFARIPDISDNVKVQNFTASAGQTAFVLNEEPRELEKTRAIVNDAEYGVPKHMTVVGVNMNWLDVDYVMQAGDTVTVVYIT
jgi:hypothetical protein